MDNWDAIKQNADTSPKHIDVLPPDNNAAISALRRYGIEKESVFGTVISNSGGIVIDRRLRIYGAGEMDITVRNEAYGTESIIIAEDIYGGFFFIGSGGNIRYFAPDTLEPEDTDLSYSQFIFWALLGDTDCFYENMCYEGWQDEAEALRNDQGISFYPPLWTKEGEDPAKCSRKAIPMREIIGFELDTRNKLGQPENI